MGAVWREPLEKVLESLRAGDLGGEAPGGRGRRKKEDTRHGPPSEWLLWNADPEEPPPCVPTDIILDTPPNRCILGRTTEYGTGKGKAVKSRRGPAAVSEDERPRPSHCPDESGREGRAE